MPRRTDTRDPATGRDHPVRAKATTTWQNNEVPVSVSRFTIAPVTNACLAAAVLAGLPLVSRAGEAEHRQFAVTVDGKPAGSYRLSFRAGDDGSQTISAAVEVRVRALLGSYTYTLYSTEVWKAGRLVSVTAASNDNGKKHAVRATAVADGLEVVVDGRARKARGAFLTSTGWREPAPSDPAPVWFDTEDGTETPVRVERRGPCNVTVGGTSVSARHYRLTGKDIDAEWWFDGAGRPVRQEMKWDGHQVVLQLTGVTR